jgi:hypothetical protein
MEVEDAKQGTGKAYTLSRLEREPPELFERACLPKDDPQHLSANAAAIQAGFRKPKTLYLSQPWHWIGFSGSVLRNNDDCVENSRQTPKHPKKKVHDYLRRPFRSANVDSDGRKDNREKVEHEVSHSHEIQQTLNHDVDA